MKETYFKGMKRNQFMAHELRLWNYHCTKDVSRKHTKADEGKNNLETTIEFSIT